MSGSDGIIPAAGEWQVAWDPPSMTCEIIVNEALYGSTTKDMSVYESFRLPGDEFSPVLLYGALFDYDASGENFNISSPELNTYVLDMADPGGVLFDVRIIDSDQMEGHYELTTPDCVFAFSFEMTRVGD